MAYCSVWIRSCIKLNLARHHKFNISEDFPWKLTWLFVLIHALKEVIKSLKNSASPKTLGVEAGY